MLLLAMLCKVPRLASTSLVLIIVVVVTAALVAASSGTVPDTEQFLAHPIDTIRIRQEVEITKIEAIDHNHQRRLLSCLDYQFKIKIRDNLFMYYVADPVTKVISMKLEYLGEAWISLGTNKLGKGAMIGSEAWMALPELPISKGNPGVFPMTTETVAGVLPSINQMLTDGTMSQVDGITTTSFARTYDDFFRINQPINVTDAPNEFVWAYGFSNAYTSEIHEGAGHFTLQVEECTGAFDAVEEIDKRKRRRACGLLRLSIFCPLTFCGLIGRFLGLCG